MRKLIILLLAAMLTACAVSPTGRHQLSLFPEQKIDQLGVQSYQKIKQETPASNNRALNNYVACVAHAITAQVGGEWEVTLFQSDQVNAFALPGNKIGVYTGLLKVTQNQGQLAAVLGHEVGHVLAHHGNARMSTQFATQTAVQLASAVAGGAGTAGGQLAMAALGAGAQVGVLLPFSRGQESEADEIGEQLMARAGFDPRESIALWQNMQRQGGNKPPEFLSTHPSEGDRIKDLQKHLPEAEQLYQQARAAGRRPNCG